MDDGAFALGLMIFIIILLVCCCCCCCGSDAQGYPFARHEGTSSISASYNEGFRGYSVSPGFIKKHVANAWEIPKSTRAKENFAERKASSYTNDPQPASYTIIRVDDTTKFRDEIAAEASRKASGEGTFTTTRRYYVVNFTHGWNGYSYDKEGLASLVLSCNPYRAINHLHYVKF